MAEALEGPHRTRVLLFLLASKGPKTKTEIWTALKVAPKVLLDSTLPELEAGGLIQVTAVRVGIRRTITHQVSLTIFGRKIAEKLEEIDRMASEARRHATVRQP